MENIATGHTGLLCLLGSPVDHSISPAMQNTACRLTGQDLCYLAFDVQPERLPAAVAGLRAIGFKGCNVTMPHKNAMAQLVDELSPAARLCGAVNTVVNQNGRLVGHTTDGVGWVHSARAEGCDPTGKAIVQLGAGGAGTAILVQAALDGAKSIAVFNMRDAFWPRVEALVQRLNQETDCCVTLHELTDTDTLQKELQKAQILLNTTPVGMKNHPGCLIPSADWLHPGLTVSDVIYEPRETELLRMARAAGLQAFNGLHMLLYQGAESFRLWTGCEMPVEQIRAEYFAE